ncbi:cobalt-precorrin-6A reductase [Novacetimonas maltaceti]|uniref:Precorrin-6A reductase n=1 Tax=Novacetimonas maltaceti TaxID=1203393 RepID=A0A2S3W0G0_9PROT|nr:cobalt-precorrin-6A reductase [Novacetimonas maltaceti]POF62365.1 Precorrin-6A reductase [Novacetimonas maltaceti]PYD59549.1 cobalt-precorrin-6A reductase [Novacetimonas maltaceti]
MRVLVLGGTTEARLLCRRLEAPGTGFVATLSLAGVTRAPVLPRMEVRIGGFGGVEGLARWLSHNQVEAVIDATHPFAARISANAVAACARTGVALARVQRPAWSAGPGDRWTMVADMAAAARAIGPAPRRILLTIGRKDLLAFRDLGTCGHAWLVRSVDAPDPALLPAGARTIQARGPFDVAGEEALLRHEGIDLVVTKNSGGAATAAKLEAARALGIAVIMVERPVLPPATVVGDVDHAMAWLRSRAVDHAGSTGRSTLRDV